MILSLHDILLPDDDGGDDEDVAGNETAENTTMPVTEPPWPGYEDKSGWIACMPMLIAPFGLVFVYPFHFMVLKLSKGAKKFNFINCAALYFPVFLAQIILFLILNLILIPIAYVAGIY